MNFVIYSSIHCSGSFENTAWNDSFKWLMILILRPLSVLFCFVLLAKWLFCVTTWYLVLAKIFWMPTLPTKWLQSQNIGMLWQFVYIHDVIDTNDNFHFLGISEKLPPVLLQIEVAFLNKYISISIKTSRLIICSKILKAEALLSNWLATLPSRRQFSWECRETLRFHVIGVLSSGFFSLFVCL